MSRRAESFLCRVTSGAMMMKRPWTEREDTYLKLHYLSKSTYEIADKLDRTYSAVSYRASYLKLKKRKARNIKSLDTKDYSKQYQVIFKMERKQNGLCIRCKDKSIQMNLCQKHFNENQQYRRQYRQKRKEQN
jgi:hypothetical protein